MRAWEEDFARVIVAGQPTVEEPDDDDDAPDGDDFDGDDNDFDDDDSLDYKDDLDD